MCTCLAEDFEAIFALLGEILMTPTIPEAELTTRKGEVVTAIRQDEDNPAVRAAESLMALLYPDRHPYGRPTKGTVEIVERLTREQLAALHAERFAPGELSAVVVGDVDTGRAHDAAARGFGGWVRPRPAAVPLARVSPATSRRRLVIPMMNKAQADVAYGFIAVARTNPDYEAFRLMNNAFGQYAIGGRLGDSIRERQGMAYYVLSSLDERQSSQFPYLTAIQAGLEVEVELVQGFNPGKARGAQFGLDTSLKASLPFTAQGFG